MNIKTLFFIIFLGHLIALLQAIQLKINSILHTCTPSCDGSVSNPFRSFVEALVYINATNPSSAELLFETTNNNIYYINQSDLTQLPRNQATGLYYIGQGLSSMTLMPNNCQYIENTVTTCSSPMVNIALNNEMTVILVNNEVVLYYVNLMRNANISNFVSIAQNFAIISLITSNSTLKILNTSISNIIALNYSYLASGTSNANFIIAYSNFSGLSFPTLINAKTGSLFQIINCIFDQINSTFLINADSSQTITLNSTTISNFIGNILNASSKNTIIFAYSMLLNITSTGQSCILLLDSNNISFYNTSFSSISNPLAYGGVLNIRSNNEMTIISSTVQNLKGYMGSFLFAQFSNNIILNSSYFTLCSSVYEAGTFYFNKKNSYIGSHNYFIQNSGWKGSVFYSNDTNIIYSEYSSYVSNKAFQIGNKEGGLGGAICLNITSNMTLYHEIFDTNAADIEGGGIFSNYSNYIALNSILFTTNSAGTNGGGLSFQLGYKIIVNNSIFIKNQAGLWGGSAYCYGYFIEIYNSYYENNAAVHGSAWFTNQGGTLNVINMTVNGSSTAWGLGGMFYFYMGNTINITNSTFLKSNIIPWSIAWVGGVFAIDRMNTFSFSNLIIEDSLSANTGGVFYIFYLNQGYLYNISIKRSKTNGAEGGVFYVGQGNTLDIIDLYSDDSVSLSIGGFMGSENDNVVTMTGVNVSNAITATGGVIYTNKNNSFTIVNCIFFNTIATSQSGMIGTWTLNNFTINNSFFTNSTSPTSGFTYLISYNTIKIYNCLFSRMSSTGFGSVLGTFQNNWIEIYNTSFINASCHGDGGAMLLEDSNNFIIENVTFQNIISNGYGGALVISLSNTINMKSSYFRNISSLSSAGGTLFIVNSNDIFIDSCVFENSTLASQGSGGFFSMSQNNTINTNNNSYLNAQITATGGVFNLGSNNLLTDTFSSFINISIINSIGSQHDGACFQAGSNNVISVLNAIFINISSENSGGLFYMSLLNNLFAINITFYNISVNFAGTLLYAEEQNNVSFNNFTGQRLIGNLFGTGVYALFSNTISINNANISDVINQGSSGGFAYVKDLNNFDIQNSVFSQILCQTTGGFFYAEISNGFVFENVILMNLTSLDSGSFLYLSRNNMVNMNDSTLMNINTGFRGGLIYAVGGNQIILGNLTINAVSGLDFGALFYLTSLNTIFFENSIINDINSYKSPGSVVYLDESNTVIYNGNTLINLQFKENIDYFYGVRNNTIIMNNDTISSNFSQIFYNLQENHTLNISNMKILSNSTFNTFIFLINGFLNIQGFLMKFTVHHAIFHIIQNSTVYISKASLMPANKANFTPTSSFQNSTGSPSSVSDSQAYFDDFICIFLQDSKLTLTRSIIINTYGINLNSIYAISSTVSIKKVLSFGAKTLHSGAFGNLFNSIAFIYNNIMIQSKALSGGCLYMNFTQDLLQNFSITSRLLLSSTTTTIQSNNILQNLALNSSRNRFKMNKARLEGGVLLYTIDPFTVIYPISFFLHQNYFENNQAWTGGAISLNNVKSGLITNNSFLNNSVNIGNFSLLDNAFYYYNFTNSSQAKGGAIHTDNSDGLFSQYNDYSNNIANIGGAVYSSTPITSLNDTYNNNNALFYGSNSASLVKSLTFLLTSSLYNGDHSGLQLIYYTEIDKMVSGVTLTEKDNPDCYLRIAGVDQFNNLAFNSDQQDTYVSNVQFIGSNTINNEYSSNLSYIIKNGQICIIGAKRNELPLPITFTFQISFNNILTNLSLSVKFRDCLMGERLTDDYRCEPCDPGFYSFQTVFTESSICLPCQDTDPFLCLGSNLLSPKQGFWRSDSTSRNFLECPKPEACIPYNITLYNEALSGNTTSIISDIQSIRALGGLNNLFYTGACEPGFTGPFCNTCDQNFGKMGKLNCILCSDSSWFYYLLIVLQIVLKVWYLFYCVLMAFKMIIAITLKQASEGAVIAINMLKILVIHVQIISFILKMPVNWSDDLKTYLPVVFSLDPDISEAFNFECFMRSLGWTFSEQYFILILCPIYILLIFLISLLFVAMRKNSSKNPTVRHLSNFKLGLCVFFIIMILTYIDLSKVNLEMFQCFNIADPSKPDYRLVNDVEVDCNSVVHLLWRYIVAVPVLALCVILVFFLVCKLTVFFLRNKMDTQETKMEFGYFYYAYKRKYYFWDFVILMRRLLILFFFLFFYEDLISKSIFPIVLMILVLFGSLGLQIYIHPFEEEFGIVNDTEQYSLVTLCLSYVIMMMYATFYFGDYVIPESLFFLTTLSLLVINGLYFAFWIRNYYVFYFSKKIRTFVQAIRDTIRKDGAVWLERLQKEHHVIFKIHNYLLKEQYLCNDMTSENYEYNDLFDNPKRDDINLTTLYAKLLTKTISQVNHKDKELAKLHDYFVSKSLKKPDLEFMLNDKNTLTLRLNRTNLKDALFNHEVLLYESPLGKFKITYKKSLRGRNYYTYQMINEIRIIGELEGEVKMYDFDKRENIFTSVEMSSMRNDEGDFVHSFIIRNKSFTNQHDYLNFYLKINNLDSLVTVYTIRLPLSILFFLKFMSLGKYSKFMEAYLILNESLLSRTYRMKSDASCRAILSDIKLIFPHNQVLKTKHSFLKKHMGIFSLLTMPNTIFTYVVKINEKMREATLELLIINDSNKNRVELQRIAYKIIQSFGYLVTNAY